MIKNAKFVTSVASSDKLVDLGVPEIAIAGRSNVGKSSFINMLTGQNKLAHTSSEPGRTRLLNFFEINGGEYYFVDLPGYGYAKVNKAEKQKWGSLIEDYLINSENLIHVFVLVDMRHEPTEDDMTMLDFLYAFTIPFTVIATKADKLSRMQQTKCRQAIASRLRLGAGDIIVTSSEKGMGKQDVYDRIDRILEVYRATCNE